MEPEKVNHPAHYNQGKIEVIDAIEGWSLGFHEGNVIKYVARHKHKNGLEDLKKAKWYLDRLIEQMEKPLLEQDAKWREEYARKNLNYDYHRDGPTTPPPYYQSTLPPAE